MSEGITLKDWIYKKIDSFINKESQRSQAKKRCFVKFDSSIAESFFNRDFRCELMREEEKAIFEKCFDEMWRKCPQRGYVFLLHAHFFLTHKEIADMLETNENNVKQIYHRAMGQMKRILAEKYPDFF
ncbi:MAG: sigma factor-like helix-turn-helix DNA-binding protein [Planctomycetia bacterium]|nr:sigma factor-like helix-turn-helix DNA-binding protein [Planctomycetia bacterium]